MLEPHEHQQRSDAGDPNRLFNRELSWLQFNRRVLGEALNPRHPLLERVKFLAIFSSNLDEFFMVRVSGIHNQIDAGVTTRSPDGLTPKQHMTLIKPVIDELIAIQHHAWTAEIQPQLEAAGIVLRDYNYLSDAQRAAARTFFHEQIFPIVTPLAFDPGHPFPHVSSLSLNLAVVVNHPKMGEQFARVKVPELLPRFIPLTTEGSTVYVWVEQIIAAHAEVLFRGIQVVASYPFRITRDADIELREDEASDLLQTIAENVRQRHFGNVIRLIIDQMMPPSVLSILMENFEVEDEDVYRVDGALGLRSLMDLYKLDRPDLKDPPFVPRLVASEDTADMFQLIQHRDMLLHHPFDSLDFIVNLLRAAAEDPQVLAIKQTLYRVGKNTPLVEALMRARENGKQVTVLVELKARFDEENNIEWAKQLERVGVHVVYGLLGLKTHCKVLLIVRSEQGRLQRYVHLSTGNYNVATARLYTDIGLLTRDPEFGADASDLFNALTGYSRQRDYRHYAVAPARLRTALLALIDREIERHMLAGDGYLIFKTNTLTDLPLIDALYRASQAGVQIDLIVRGVCCLRPGVPGLSQTIRVRSIVGRFLEHSRIYYCRNGGADEVYLSSADLMHRNLDRRVEVMFPVRQPEVLRYLRDTVLTGYLRDTANAHVLQPGGTYTRPTGDEPPFDIHAALAA
jgi:polyphosphate kinase